MEKSARLYGRDAHRVYTSIQEELTREKYKRPPPNPQHCVVHLYREEKGVYCRLVIFMCGGERRRQLTWPVESNQDALSSAVRDCKESERRYTTK